MAPEPRAEMVALIYDDTIVFHVASRDARQTLEAEGPTYGRMFPDLDGNTYTLYVSPLYAVAEVAEHFAPGNVTTKRAASTVLRWD